MASFTLLRAALLAIAAGNALATEPAPQDACLLQKAQPALGRHTSGAAHHLPRDVLPEADTEADTEAEADALPEGDSGLAETDALPEAEADAGAVDREDEDSESAEGAEDLLDGVPMDGADDQDVAEPAAELEDRAFEQKKELPPARQQQHGGVRRRRRTGLPSHGTQAAQAVAAIQAKKARESSEPGEFIEIRGWPDTAAPLVGLLKAGEKFRVKEEHRTSAGEMWLELSDGRGFIPRAKAVQERRRKEPQAEELLEEDDSVAPVKEALEEAGGEPISEGTAPNGFPKKVFPKHDVDHDAMHMSKTKMSIDSLPEGESRHENHKTQTADWRAEYPTAAPSPAAPKSGAANALPAVAVLAACLAWGL